MITEIYCDQCKGYNTVGIPDNVNGLHIVICGKCGHEHYRCINEGQITDKRYDEHILKKIKLSAFTYRGKWRNCSWEVDPFLSELWAGMSV